MHDIYHIQGEMKEEINHKTKKVWEAPKLDILDARKTKGGCCVELSETTDYDPDGENMLS